MKKLLICLLICFSFLIVGCSSSGGITLVANSDGTIVELYYAPFPMEQIISITGNNLYAQQKSLKFIYNVQKDLNNQLFSPLLNLYQERVLASEEYSDEKKIELIGGVLITNNLPSQNAIVVRNLTAIEYRISYANTECFNLFKDITKYFKEPKEIEKTVSLLTTTTKVVKDPLFDKILEDSSTIGKKYLSFVEENMRSEYGEGTWTFIKESLNYERYSKYFTFTYVVPTARIHSNADSVKKVDDYYYHEWQIPVENIDENGNSIKKIEYWQTTANRWVWYCIALTGAIVVALITAIRYKVEAKKQKIVDNKKQQIFNIEE
ncbi:MAG: hypothetical protein J6T74_05670 [Clostridia bacterium]|nr:hypothetical protein [Clostridia bacterium]